MCSAASTCVFFINGKDVDGLPSHRCTDDIWRASMERDAFFSQAEVIMTPTFLRSWLRLSSKKQAGIQQKIGFLVQNHRHPSLRTHQLHRSGGELWSCSLSKTE